MYGWDSIAPTFKLIKNSSVMFGVAESWRSYLGSTPRQFYEFFVNFIFNQICQIRKNSNNVTIFADDHCPPVNNVGSGAMYYPYGHGRG